MAIVNTVGEGVSSSVDTNMDLATPLHQGIQTGIQLAAHEEQIKQSREALSMKQEEMKQTAISGAFDMLPKLAKTKGKAKDMMFDIFSRRMQMAGVPVNPAIKDVLGSQDDDAYTMAVLSAKLRANPELMKDPRFMGMAGQYLGDPEKFMEMNKALLTPLQEEVGKNSRAQLEAASKTQNATAANEVKKLNAAEAEKTRRAQINAQMVKTGNQPILNPDGSMNQENVDAAVLTNHNAENAKIRATVSNADANQQRATTDHGFKEGMLNINQQRANAYDRYVDQAKTKITATLGTRQASLANRADDSVANSVKNAKAASGNAERGEQLLARGEGQIKWADLNEANLDLVNLLQGGKGVIPISRQKALEPPRGLKGIYDRIASNIQGQEVGGPTQEEINIIKDRLARVKGAVEDFHDTELARGYKAKTSVGALNANVAEQLFNMRKIHDTSQFGTSQSRSNRGNINPSPVPAGQPAPAPAPANVDVNQVRQQAQAAIAAGKDPAAVKALYKQKTGQELQ